MWPLVRILAPLVALVLLLPGSGAAAAQQEPPGTPTETSPPPAEPAPPVETVTTIDVPDEPDTTGIVVLVPPEPAPKRVAVPTRSAPPERKSHSRRSDSRTAPTGSREAAESRQSSAPIVAPAESAKADRKRKQQKPSRPVRAAPPHASRPGVIHVPDHSPAVIRDMDHMPAAGVLAVQFSSASVDPSAPASNTTLYLALTLAVLLAMLVSLVAAAPSLSLLWPRVFAPVIHAQEQLLLAAACVVCAAITLAITLVITWAITGPIA